MSHRNELIEVHMGSMERRIESCERAIATLESEVNAIIKILRHNQNIIPAKSEEGKH